METNLGLELQKIDTNGKKGLEGKEIDKFLENEENLRQLGEIIQNQFGAETGELLEFKEDIGKICDRILKLKENNNTKNQQIILLFYIKHFMTENDKMGGDIIKKLVDRLGDVAGKENDEIVNVLNDVSAKNQLLAQVICKEILKQKYINRNHQIILLFYLDHFSIKNDRMTIDIADNLKHFSIENDEMGKKIIDKLINKLGSDGENDEDMKIIGDALNNIFEKNPGLGQVLKKQIRNVCDNIMKKKEISSYQMFPFGIYLKCVSPQNKKYLDDLKFLDKVVSYVGNMCESILDQNNVTKDQQSILLFYLTNFTIENDKNNIGTRIIEYFINKLGSGGESGEDVVNLLNDVCAKNQLLAQLICETVLEQKNIVNNQQKILLFYMDHFLTENDEVGVNIVEYFINKFGNEGENEENMEIIGDALDNAFEKNSGLGQVLKEQIKELCIDIIKKDSLSSYQIYPLGIFLRNIISEDENLGEIISNLRKYRPIQYGGLELDYPGIGKYKQNFRYFLSMLKVDEKLERGMEIFINGIGENILSEKIPTLEDINKLRSIRYDQYGEKYLTLDNKTKIDQKLKFEEELEAANSEIIADVDKESFYHAIENLDAIDKNLRKMKPNWGKLKAEIKTPKDVEKISDENIGDYLPLSGDIGDDTRFYITQNFKNILTRHLCLHEGYKINYGKNPDNLLIDMTLEGIVRENKQFELAIESEDKIIEGLDAVLGVNNHILFEWYIGSEIRGCKGKNSGERNQKICEKIYKIFSDCVNNKKYKNQIKEFCNKNGFIKDQYDTYIKIVEAKKRIEEENKNREEHQSILNTAKKIRILGKDGYFFSRKQLESYKKYYKVKKWDQFDKLYDASVTFWKNFEDNLKLLCLPTCISIEDYAKFVEQMDVMKNNIDKINNQYRQNIRSIVSTYDACDGMTGTLGAMASREKSSQIGDNQSERNSKINEELMKTARMYVKIWQKSPGKRRPNNFYGLTLNFAKGRDVESIIRDTFTEKLGNKWDSFIANIKGLNIQKAVGDLGGLIIGAVVGIVVTTASWGNSVLGGAAFEVGSTLGNGLCNVSYDFLVDGLCGKCLGLLEESGNNRYDGPIDSFLLGIGLKERDENGIPVQKISWGEFTVNKLFDVGAGALSGALGGNILKAPFKYAAADTFISQPIKNITQETLKASLDIGKYKDLDVTAQEVYRTTVMDEYNPEALLDKTIKTLVLGGVLSGIGRLYKFSSGYFKGVDFNCFDGLKREGSEIMSFLKDHGITENLGGNFQSCLYKNMGKLMEDGFGELLSNYQNQIFNVWPVINTVMSSTLVTYDLLGHDMPPLAVVRRRIELMKDKIKIGDKAAYKYMELLARYEMVERELSLGSMDVDEIMPNGTNAGIIGDGTDVMEDASDGTDVMEDASDGTDVMEDAQI